MSNVEALFVFPAAHATASKLPETGGGSFVVRHARSNRELSVAAVTLLGGKREEKISEELK